MEPLNSHIISILEHLKSRDLYDQPRKVTPSSIPIQITTSNLFKTLKYCETKGWITGQIEEVRSGNNLILVIAITGRGVEHLNKQSHP